MFRGGLLVTVGTFVAVRSFSILATNMTFWMGVIIIGIVVHRALVNGTVNNQGVGKHLGDHQRPDSHHSGFYRHGGTNDPIHGWEHRVIQHYIDAKYRML